MATTTRPRAHLKLVVLIGAALLGGLYWGLLYARFGSAVVNVLSHVAFDLSAFVLFPFTE